MSSEMPSRLLNADEAGELLGVPKTWVMAEARADRIPHVRFGRYVRFEAAALEAWWRARVRGPSLTELMADETKVGKKAEARAILEDLERRMGR